MFYYSLNIIIRVCDKKMDCFCNNSEFHKGFYNDDDPMQSLCNIEYTEFFELPDDDDFPYWSAWSLLCGSCELFALALQEMLGYNPYVIEGTNGTGFHAFCQIYKNGKWYYVDARGITSCFNEFMDVAKIFVKNEYIIRPVSATDIDEWKKEDEYGDIKAGLSFAKAVIEKYQLHYVL